MSVPQGLDARPADDILRCKAPADIVFLVDSSTSIEKEDFNGPMKTFLKDVISTFDVGQGPEQTRIGMVLFSTDEHLEFHLNKYKVGQLTHTFGISCTNSILMPNDILQQTQYGKHNVTKIMS